MEALIRRIFNDYIEDNPLSHEQIDLLWSMFDDLYIEYSISEGILTDSEIKSEVVEILDSKLFNLDTEEL